MSTRERAPALLLATTLAVALFAAVLLATAAPSTEGSEDFQRLVGGLGLGPAVDLSRCPAEFDPRVDAGCALGGEPLPASTLFCPVHAGR
ncbi:MAG: hypothetical protein ACHQ1G_10250 [Planctomycetota bacterium]